MLFRSYYPTDIGVSPFFNVVPDGNGGVTPGFSGAIGAGYPVGCATTIDKFTNPSSNCMTNFVLRFMNPCISADHSGFHHQLVILLIKVKVVDLIMKVDRQVVQIQRVVHLQTLALFLDFGKLII